MTESQNVTAPNVEASKPEFVNLFKVEGKEDTFKWELNGIYFYMFPCSDEWKMKWVEYWTAWFKTKEAFDKRMAWERVDWDYFFGIGVRTSKNNPNNSWLGWILSDDVQKKAWYVTLKDNQFKKEWRWHDKYLQLKQANYIEKKPKDESSLPREWEDQSNDVL